ncbi:MAG: glycoside hydrolase family 16 protein [Acidimicrobiales bacterium]
MAVAALLLSLIALTADPAAAADNLCERGDFQRTYRNDFGGRDTISDWSIYNGPGHAGNGLRRPSAVKKYHGKLVITANRQGNKTVSGGMSKRGLSQTYGCYRFRVRTDHDYSNVTSGVVMTWPTNTGKKNGGENDIYETTHRYSKRKPFMTFIHKPGDHSGNSREQHWYRHDAQADRYQIMTMVWTPDEMIIRREGLDIRDRYTVTEHTVPRSNIPHVPHHPTIQLDARTGGMLSAPVRLELDWFEVYRYTR